MIVLGIETSGDTASIAIGDGQTVLASSAFPARASLCERLILEVQSLGEQLAKPWQFDAIAVSRGPGSFTSLRIGVITAKALAHRLKTPLVGIPTPEIVAWPFARQGPTTVAVMLPAWNQGVYLAVYLAEKVGHLREVYAPVAVSPEKAINMLGELEGPIMTVGTRALEHREAISRALGPRVEFATPSLCEPDAAVLTEMAPFRLSDADPQVVFRLRPLYVVPSQAERVAGIDLGLTGDGPCSFSAHEL